MKDIIEQRKVGKEVVRLLDLPFSLNNLTALERAAERVQDIKQENGHTVIVVKNR